jgi:hypothetical protein
LQGSVRIQKDKIGYFELYFASISYVLVLQFSYTILTFIEVPTIHIFKVCYNQRSAISSKTKLFLFSRILWNL